MALTELGSDARLSEKETEQARARVSRAATAPHWPRRLPATFGALPRRPRASPAATLPSYGRPDLVRAKAEPTPPSCAPAAIRSARHLLLDLRRRIVAVPGSSGRRLAAGALEPESSLADWIAAAAPPAASRRRPAPHSLTSPGLYIRRDLSAVHAVSLIFASLVCMPQWPAVVRKVSTASGTPRPVSRYSFAFHDHQRSDPPQEGVLFRKSGSMCQPVSPAVRTGLYAAYEPSGQNWVPRGQNWIIYR
uniref:Uncharacterized protein n=1 Tax=Ananas comosus var. bracteatus TaxID=296719 RepID=A0A6V7NJ95_ANACO|nr:unnamed protein product [Ananas comosus var. bracteatus]